MLDKFMKDAESRLGPIGTALVIGAAVAGVVYLVAKMSGGEAKLKSVPAEVIPIAPAG